MNQRAKVVRDAWLLNQMPLNRQSFEKDKDTLKLKVLNITSSCLNFLLPLLVFLSPSQFGYHFWPDNSLIFGIRIDYLSPTIFVSDLIIFLILIGVVIQLIFGGRRKQLSQLKKTISWKRSLPLACLLLINIFFSISFVNSIFFILKLLELLFLGIYLTFFNTLEEKKWFYYPLALSVICFGLIGFGQFCKGGTIGGLFYYLGERSFSRSSSGVSLVNLFGQDYLRAYSTFSHPNSFAGFFGLTAIIFLITKQLSSRVKTRVVVATLFFLVFTFSRLASGALILVLVLYSLLNKNKNLLIKVTKGLLVSAFIVSLLSLLVLKNINSLDTFSQSVGYRLFSVQVSGEIFKKYSWVGVGLNNFIPAMVDVSKGNSNVWFLQPVHNIYLLLLSETGLVGFLVGYFLLSQLINELVKSSKTEYLFPLMFILLTDLLDHYWLTLNQNRLLLTFFLAAILKPKRV